MNKNKTQDKQQILFEDNELLSLESMPETSPTSDGKQVIFNNTDYVPVDIIDDSPSQLDNDASFLLKNKEKSRWLWRVFLSLFVIVFFIEMVDFFMVGFDQSPIITSLYAMILAGLVVVSSTTLFREISGLRQFKRRQILKEKANEYLTSGVNLSKPNSTEAINSDSLDLDIEQFCQQITASLPCDLLSEQEDDWQKVLKTEHSQAELLQLYSRLVLCKVDEKALTEITKFSTEAIVLVALSPLAIVDMLIMLWRNLRMINKISGLYGLKLGYWSRIKLVKQVFMNMVYAGAGELISDFGTEILGADLLGKLSGRLAQGLGAGMLTARLGIKTMELCRPISFEEKPKLRLVRNKMLGTIKKLLKSNNI